MDGSDSHGHKQVNDRQHKAFQMIRSRLVEHSFFGELSYGYAGFWYFDLFISEAFLMSIVRFH